LSGESLLAVAQSTVPSVGADTYTPVAYPPRSGSIVGRRMQKAGNEHFALFPREGELSLPEGAYYLAVVGEGMNTPDSYRIGTGSSSYVLQSLGVRRSPTRPPETVATAVTNALEGGQMETYRFTVRGAVASKPR
jgi:hypothetical protein